MARSFRVLIAVLVSAIGATLMAQSTPRTSTNIGAQGSAAPVQDPLAAAPIRLGPISPGIQLAPPVAPNVVLYDQTSNPGVNSTGSQNFEASFDTFDDELAEDFVVPGGQTWSVSEVDAIGVYFNGTGPADSFNVVFYTNSAGFPGSVVCTRAAMTYSNVSGSFNIAVSPACVLSPGTYWVSVQSNQNFTPAGQWGWTDRTVTSNNGAAWRNPGNGFGSGCTGFGRKTTCIPTATDPDQVFRLVGTLGSPPSSCDAFQAKAAAPIDVYGAAVASSGIHIYAAGGYSFSLADDVNTLRRYNPVTNGWVTFAPMADPTTMASAVYAPINNKLYVFGGERVPTGVVSNATRVYDIASNTWSTGANMPAVRAFMASGYHNGKIYLVGGYTDGTVTSAQAQVWEYDPIANTWNTSRMNIPHAFGGAGSGVIAGHLYVGGGRDGVTSNLNLLYDYNIAANTWTARANLPTGMNVPASGVVNGQFWLMGGGNPFSPATAATTMFYEPSLNAWGAGGNLTQARSFGGGTGFDGKLFVTGGYNGSTTVTTTETAECGRPFGDVDIDRKTDRTVYRNGVWFTAKTGGGATITGWGTGTDIDVLGDYDGDRIADVAIWRPSSGTWFIVQSSGGVRVDTWGQSGDIPIAGDIDGDGKADLIIFRPSAGAWFVKLSSGASPIIFGWGLSTDYPLVGDYDGDGRADFVAYRPSTGVWYIALAGGGTQFVGWGTPGDIPVSGNYDGDARYDPTIFRPTTGQWFVNGSRGPTLVVGWGQNGDIPVSGDWDGDGVSDFTIWRDGNGTWYTQFAVGGTAGVAWGISGDKPSGRRPGT